MLLCLHTTAANAFDVLPPPKNYKEVHGLPVEEERRAACIEEFRARYRTIPLTWLSVQKTRSSARPSRCSPTSSTTTALLNDARLAWSSAATVNDLKSIRQDLHGNC
eukprot:5683800-Pleurochrysis_carterae.AAC.1